MQNFYRVWQDAPILVIVNMLAYFCFLEQLLVSLTTLTQWLCLICKKYCTWYIYITNGIIVNFIFFVLSVAYQTLYKIKSCPVSLNFVLYCYFVNQIEPIYLLANMIFSCYWWIDFKYGIKCYCHVPPIFLYTWPSCKHDSYNHG